MINASGVIKNFGHRRAVDDVSFEAQKGAVVGILGPDSADKAGRLDEQFSKWTYVISSYAADSMTLSRDTLVKAKKGPPISADNP